MPSTGVGVTPRYSTFVWWTSGLFACPLPCHHDFDHVSTETFHMIPDLIDLIFFYNFLVIFSFTLCFPLGLCCI